MPPKGKAKGDKGPSKKTEQKQKDKVIEDKTFGMKNKKGTKQQKYIQMVQKQVQHGNQKASKMEQLKQQEKGNKKEEKRKAAAELNALFKPVEQKVAKGVDPKSVVCAFFKQGLCTKGEKCKFSHDLNVQRKGEKRSMYEDAEKENMDDWDEAKLEEVVNKKHGESNKGLPGTTIICKYFLDAVENSKYGWFWECPNGKTCHYRHALPPGFVLKKDQKKEDKGPTISLEELIEKERAALSSSNLTKVTLESFLIWKERKRKEKIKKFKAETEKKKADYKAGKSFGVSGRELFEFNPDLIAGDDDEAEDIVYKRQDEEDEEGEEGDIRELTIDDFSTPSMAASAAPGGARSVDPMKTGDTTTASTTKTDEDKLDQAAALPSADEAISIAMAATVNGADPGISLGDVDENLFDGDDIDLVEEELETLELDD